MPKGKKKHHRAAEKHYTDDEIILRGIQFFMQINGIQTISSDCLPNGDCDITFEPDKDYSDNDDFETVLKGLILYMGIHNLKHANCHVDGNRIEVHGKQFASAVVPYNIMTTAAIKKHSASVEAAAECP